MGENRKKSCPSVFSSHARDFFFLNCAWKVCVCLCACTALVYFKKLVLLPLLLALSQM